MTPEQKLKHMILIAHAGMSSYDYFLPESVTADNIDKLYEDAYEDEGNDCLQDAREEIRYSGTETGLPSPSSRHYEADEVAAKAPDGSWIGWTYWHGGGKHGEPGAIDWIDEAYDLTVTEKEEMTVVRTFVKA